MSRVHSEKLNINQLYEASLKEISSLNENLKRGDELIRIGELESYNDELFDKLKRQKKHIAKIESQIKSKNNKIEILREKNKTLASGIDKDERILNMGSIIGSKNKEISRLKKQNSDLVAKIHSLRVKLIS